MSFHVYFLNLQRPRYLIVQLHVLTKDEIDILNLADSREREIERKREIERVFF